MFIPLFLLSREAAPKGTPTLRIPASTGKDHNRVACSNLASSRYVRIRKILSQELEIMKRGVGINWWVKVCIKVVK